MLTTLPHSLHIPCYLHLASTAGDLHPCRSDDRLQTPGPPAPNRHLLVATHLVASLPSPPLLLNQRTVCKALQVRPLCSKVPHGAAGHCNQYSTCHAHHNSSCLLVRHLRSYYQVGAHGLQIQAADQCRTHAVTWTCCCPLSQLQKARFPPLGAACPRTRPHSFRDAVA